MKRSVRLSVDLSVGQLYNSKKLWTDSYNILWRGGSCPRKNWLDLRGHPDSFADSWSLSRILRQWEIGRKLALCSVRQQDINRDFDDILGLLVVNRSDHEGLQSACCKPSTTQAVQNYKSWWHDIWKMCRLVMLLMLRSQKLCSNFNPPKIFNQTIFNN